MRRGGLRRWSLRMETRTMLDLFFQRSEADILTRMRIQTRRKRRITYDCMSAIVKGEIVVCKKGHTFKARGRSNKAGISVFSVLNGTSSAACRNCEDYDEETDE